MATPVATPARKMSAKALTKAMGLGITVVSFEFERSPLSARYRDMGLNSSSLQHKGHADARPLCRRELTL